MSFKQDNLTADVVASLSKRHVWAATGVSDYPPRDPLVGQSRFFNRFRNFIQTVDQEADNFAHVFAVEAEWGRGKSRIGHELIAQINACSKGWFVREQDGKLADKQLFAGAEQDKYLALYIRYSQIASDFQNSDNWFGFGLYKALIPLATGKFDGSIQSKIAEQALHRLQPAGFESSQLAETLELAADYDDEALYEEDGLVVRLVQAAYAYLEKFGIQYVLVVLDELETVAEAATFGLEQDDTKRLDGQAIRLIGKAIKEEDPRRKLPWLRYVALCSPLLGQQLREIQSVARRFELVELEHNAFADVSDYVAQLKQERKLGFAYPTGLVEAAYAMSGANFGWFNVIMANVDAVLAQFEAAGKAMPAIVDLFDEVVAGSGRVAQHVLDVQAIEGIKTADHDLKAVARALLYGQLPVALNQSLPRSNELLTLENEDSGPVASLYRTVAFDSLKCRQALEEAKFKRDKEEWFYPAVEQGLNLNGLLQNLRTFAINEAADDVLLLPLSQLEFRHLLTLLYDHPAVDYIADALWHKLIGSEKLLPASDATHIGPSVAMLLRLDLRYRQQQHNALIFREPLQADAFELAMKKFAQDSSKNTALRWQVRLTGLFRLLDKNWQYAQQPYPNRYQLTVQLSPKGQGAGQRGGLLFCEALKLHPDNLAWFAWVNNRKELDNLHVLATQRHSEDGRFPVLAFTASAHLMEQYNRGGVSEKLQDDVLLYYLNASEVDQIERIGLLPEYCQDFALNDNALTSKFKNKLYTLRDFSYQAMQQWRLRLNQRGLIAWPLRPTGKLNPQERDLLFRAWKLFAVEEPKLTGLNDLEPRHGINAEELAALLQRLALPNKFLSLGYWQQEHAGLFTDLANPQLAQAQTPLFLARNANPAKAQEWTFERAKRKWYWAYLSQAGGGLTPKNVFDDWMWWCGELHLLQLEDATANHAKWLPYPRAKLDNAIIEANNWFAGDNSQQGFQHSVKLLERVFGYEQIMVLFAPLSKSPAGTQTVAANDQLLAARKRFDKLKVEEEALALLAAEDLATIAEKLPVLLQGRSEVLARVGQVKPVLQPTISLGNINTLRLDDKSHSLYQRIEQARLFADYVEHAAKQIKARIAALIADIEADIEGLSHFPKSLFTLSLQLIANLLDGALQQDNPSGTSQFEGGGSSDTLLYYLRSLSLDKAAERLELLAEEAGVNLANGKVTAVSEIRGNIVFAYRKGKEKYETASDYLDELQSRCQRVVQSLTPLPADYQESAHPQAVMALQQKLVLISDAFEDLAESVKIEREKFREQALKGRFSAILEVTERLINPIMSQLHPIAGELATVENTIQSYRNSQLIAVNEQYCAPLAPLFKACKQAAPEPVRLEHIKAMSLHDAQIYLDAQVQKWERQAANLLADTGLDVQAWRELAAAIAAGENPAIAAEITEHLVRKGILQVKLSFGGGA